jgi:hypothetical protein
MDKKKIIAGVLLIAMLVMAGCSTQTPASRIVSAKEGYTVQEKSLIEKAKQDLSKRLSIPEDQISLKSIESVEWSDTSLGCPEKGKMYAQVVVPGYKIILEAQGKTYEYHAGGSSVIFCEKSGRGIVRQPPPPKGNNK